MKWILTIVFSLLLFTTYSTNFVYNNTLDYSYSRFATLCTDWLKIDSTDIYIIKSRLPIAANIIKNSDKSFTILINANLCDNVQFVLAHELAHIRQYLNGEEVFTTGSKLIASGSKYTTKKAELLDKEADKIAMTLIKRFKKYEADIRKGK